MKDFPSADRFIFIVCDDARQEQFNKISVMGWFPDRKIHTLEQSVRADANAFAIQGISLILVFIDGEGEFQANIQVMAPGGKQLLPPAQRVLVKKLSGQPLMINVRLTPFIGEVFGEFSVIASLDDKQYASSFSVLPSEPPAAAAGNPTKH